MKCGISGVTTAMLIGFMAMVSPAHGEDEKSRVTDKIAIVNGVPIDRADFDGQLLMMQKTLLGFGKPLTCRQVSSVQNEVLESLIRREVLYQESIKSGFRPDEKATNEEIATLRQQFSNEAEFKNELRKRNISEETLRSRIERNSSIQRFIERQFSSKLAVTDTEAAAYYEGHLDLFTQPLQVRVSHILIQTDPGWEESRRQEVRRKAEQILKSLRGGQDFATLAREQSDGPTKMNGGDLGYVKTGQLEKPFERVVFSLKPGETSEIVETSRGFHLFKMFDQKPEKVLAFDEVKEKIRKILRDEKAKQEADLLAKALREKAGVEIFLNEDMNLHSTKITDK